MASVSEQGYRWVPEGNLMDMMWRQIHESFIRRTTLRKNDIKVVFIGASIVQNWCSEGRHIWEEYYSPKGAFNYGIGGDTIQNVLWRVDSGEMDGLQPRIVVIQCGTNNIEAFGPPTEEDISRGISQLIERLRQKLANSKVIVCPILPLDHPIYQSKANRINELLAKNSDNLNVFFCDLTQDMIDSNGEQKSHLFTDGLHLSTQGYNSWHQSMKPLFERLYNN